MKYKFREIEKKWQNYWATNQTFKAENHAKTPKYYVLDMFPYPSGAGLHVGHPLGYIASDICARYKRHKGFNVLHPMGYDSFGLPAEQYAIQTGQHPAITTAANIKRYREQLDELGFSFDWSREVQTSDPKYYRWTQWVFIQLFNSWYNTISDTAEPISTLESIFEKNGNIEVSAACDEDTPVFTALAWKDLTQAEKQRILLKYRLTYLAEAEVNWCPALGTVLANDEVINGVSERGGHPVIRKKMTQWMMRITAYAQRLLDDLATVDWPQPLKDSQTNWIGRSEGASAIFNVIPNADVEAHETTGNADTLETSGSHKIAVFTTRPDTIFGVSFMTLAPEHDLVDKITTPEQKAVVNAYVAATAKRSERDRLSDVKTISGAFTGAYAEHPFTKARIPIWIGDYVLAGYGTGAVMAVPCGDQRDYDFAKHFDIPIPNIFKGVDITEEAFADKANTVIANSDFLNGLDYPKATRKVIAELERIGQGKGKINYRLRDAVFSRQRYWGEPFPVYYDAEGIPRMLADQDLPLELPEVKKYLPTETGEPPLGNATTWAWDTNTRKVVDNTRIDHKTVFPLELNTMPGWAGSSQYFNRYMDPHNQEVIYSKEAIDYWEDVDLYIGGSEHATGHLLYSRFWQKFMYDRGWAPKTEFARKLINQGMILGTSAIVYRVGITLYIKVGYSELSGRNTTQLGDILKVSKKNNLYVSKGILQEAINLKSENLPHWGFDQIQEIENLGELFERVILKYELTSEEIDGVMSEKYVLVYNVTPIRLDVNNVNSSDEIISFADMTNWNEHEGAEFLLEEGKYIVHREVEKMSKRWLNVVNPDQICEDYGADSLRLYEMFLGPLEQSKPWNTAGITGVHGFLKKLWKLYQTVDESTPTAENLKTLHKTIKKVEEDIENFSFNTSVATFMICVNELTAQKCASKAILEPLTILVSPYAPHIAEELWEKLGHPESIAYVPFPQFEEKYLVESTKEYPISFNGKMRFTLELPLDMDKSAIESAVMAHERTAKYLEGRTPKKVIVVPGKIVNIVG